MDATKKRDTFASTFGSYVTFAVMATEIKKEILLKSGTIPVAVSFFNGVQPKATVNFDGKAHIQKRVRRPALCYNVPELSGEEQ